MAYEGTIGPDEFSETGLNTSRELPLAMRVMENMPGITPMVAFNARRVSNTFFKGGFLDVEAGASKRKLARAGKRVAFVGDEFQVAGKEAFLFGGFKTEAKLAGKSPWAKQAFFRHAGRRSKSF